MPPSDDSPQASTPSPLSPLRRVAAAGTERLQAAVRAPFGGVPGPLPRRGRDTSFDDVATAEQERGMRAFWWDGFWSSSSEVIIANYFGLYLLAFGASNSQVGLLASMSSLFAALAFIPGAQLVERIGQRKRLVLYSGGGVARVALLAIALVPFFAHDGVAVWLIIGLASFRGFWGYFAVPAWTSLTADIVPMGMRGRFLASRNFGMGIAALATAPLAGYLVDSFSGLHGWQLVWLVAFATGAISTWCYAHIPEPRTHPHVVEAQRATTDRGLLADIIADRNFMLYLASVGVWNIALQAAGPFFNIYLVKHLHASTAMVGFLVAVPSLTGLLGFLVFGRMMDQRGTKWMMNITGLMIPLLPAAWIIVTAAWQIIIVNAVAGLLWAGYNLALMNMVMVMAPPAKRARYAAAFQTVTFIGAFVGPLIGSAIIDAVGFRAVFAFSAIGRMGGALLLLYFVQHAYEAHPPATAAATRP